MNQPTFTTLRTDTIQCPGCDTIQAAQVVQVEGAPFASFVHECAACGYIILESEWDVVDALALATKLAKILALVDSGDAPALASLRPEEDRVHDYYQRIVDVLYEE